MRGPCTSCYPKLRCPRFINLRVVAMGVSLAAERYIERLTIDGKPLNSSLIDRLKKERGLNDEQFKFHELRVEERCK